MNEDYPRLFSWKTVYRTPNKGSPLFIGKLPTKRGGGVIRGAVTRFLGLAHKVFYPETQNRHS